MYSNQDQYIDEFGSEDKVGIEWKIVFEDEMWTMMVNECESLNDLKKKMQDAIGCDVDRYVLYMISSSFIDLFKSTF